jgi:diadenosine tetraphosphate (Ap4A) HIT family hydrolase
VSRHSYDEVLRANANYVVVPSLGALVPGWSLVIPRRPLLNLSGLQAPERENLLALVSEFARDLGVFGDPVYAFEHGSSMSGSVVGCGVEQAHLHVVPLPFDLVEAVTTDSSADVTWTRTAAIPLNELPTATDYVAVWRLDTGAGVVGALATPVSQWVRRVIARELGVEAEWDYRTNPQMMNVKKTVAELRAQRQPMMLGG